jgi:hypothetical protein
VRGRLFPVGADWYEWRQSPPLPGTVLIQVAQTPDGRLVLSGLRVDGTPTAELLRSIPVGRIEAAANAQLTIVDDRISGVASAGPRDGPAPHRPAQTPGGWETVDPSRAARRPDLAWAHGGAGGGQGGAQGGAGAGRGAGGRRGEGGGRGDGGAAGRRGRPEGFYAEVAHDYRHLAQESSRPAAELAEARGVPVTTAHRWIKEARRRGLLPPGRPGKEG